jgi:asparagine synthase (glutamine-hydrolysing)
LEYVPTLPDEYKIKGKTTKFILRQLAKKYLPDTLINQPKRGFEIPLKKWIDNELKEPVFDYLSCGNNFYSNFVQPQFVKDILTRKIKIADEKRAKILWTLLSLEIWHKKVYQ